MAQYDANRNRGYNTNGIIEPGYGGRKHAVVGNPATSESYVATSEQVVEVPATAGHQHSPRRKVYKDHGVGDNPLLGPWSSALEKGDKFSPKFGQSKGSTQNIRDNSPPSGDHYAKNNSNLSSSDDDDDENDVICKDGVCFPKPKHIKKEEYDNEKHKGNGYAAPWARAKADRKYTGTIDSKEAVRKYNGVFVEDKRYTGTIDSKEAARKYNGVFVDDERYTGTIDSKEAARKYNGVFVPASLPQINHFSSTRRGRK